jgi:uncharacterized protein YraI
MRRATGIGFSLASVLGLGLAALAAPASLGAETAFTTKTVSLRAGPGRDYPLVASVGPGTPVDVGGCTDDYAWCDVGFQGDHGWAWAGNLEYPYEGRRVVIYGHGPVIGLPITPFAAGPYWDTYYRGRPWYGRRSYWVGRPYVGRPYAGRPYVGRSPVYRSPAGRSPGSRHPVVERPHASRPEARPGPRPESVHREAPRAQPERRAAPQRQQQRPERQQQRPDKKKPG